MDSFEGVHSTTGTITNCLRAMGTIDAQTMRPYSEALVLGASGGIAFGYFVFEYKGQLPHVSILTRNTFTPFARALDNLAIRRETRERLMLRRLKKTWTLLSIAAILRSSMADHFPFPDRLRVQARCGTCAPSWSWPETTALIPLWTEAEPPRSRVNKCWRLAEG